MTLEAGFVLCLTLVFICPVQGGPLRVAHLAGVSANVMQQDGVVLAFDVAEQNVNETSGALLANFTPTSMADVLQQKISQADEAAKQEEQAAIAAIPRAQPEVDQDYLDRILDQDSASSNGPGCDGLTTCNACMHNRKCAYCATDSTCSPVADNTCKHAWSAFWPRGKVASGLIGDLCQILFEDYAANPPKSLFDED